MTEPLFVVPTFLRTDEELATTEAMIESLRKHHPKAPLLLVDDCSPQRELVAKLEGRKEELEFGLHEKPENTGFSSTVNIGLRHALDQGLDAVLCNADIFFEWPVIEEMQATVDTQGRPAAVVGARLLYPIGLIQHAGVYFSLLHRVFEHRYKYAPHDLPEAQVPKRCPVTGALQYIRLETLEKVGVYDEDFHMAFEDVDFCLRVFDAGLDCIYSPKVAAYHYESLFRGSANEKIDKWHAEAWQIFMSKHQSTGMGPWVWPLT